MTRQTWTAFVSALAFICLAVLLVVIPVPFVSWSPGGTRDTLGNVGNEPMIKVQGMDTYATTGRLDMTIVAITPADARLSLPQALLAYWLPHRDVSAARRCLRSRQIGRRSGERGRRHDGNGARRRGGGRPARRWAAGYRDAGHLLGHRRWACSQALASGRSGGFCRRRGHSRRRCGGRSRFGLTESEKK